jgi:hypothetical protein
MLFIWVKRPTFTLNGYLRADGPFEGKDDYFDPVPKLYGKIWTSAIRRLNFHVNCIS